MSIVFLFFAVKKKKEKTMKQFFKTNTLLLQVLLIVFFAVNSFGATYYVDNGGAVPCSNNSSFGSESQPWCSVAYAVNQISGGDTLYVKAGTYKGPWTMSDVDGSEESPTLIKAYPGHSVILDGDGAGRIKFHDCSHVIFDGFQVTDLNQGIWVQYNSDHIMYRIVSEALGEKTLRLVRRSAPSALDTICWTEPLRAGVTTCGYCMVSSDSTMRWGNRLR